MLLKKIIALICAAIIGTSCGYLSEEPLESKEIYNADSSMGGCDIDADAFAKILEEDIDGAIKCLEDSFHQFEEGIRRPNHDQIDRHHIAKFVDKFFKDNTTSIIDALGLLFKLNMIILKDNPDSLSTENIANIANLLRITNKSAIVITDIFDQMSQRDELTRNKYESNRDRFVESVTMFSSSVLNLVSTTMNKKNSINIIEFLEELKDTADMNLDIDQIKNLLGLKVLIVGGDQETLTSEEVDRFLEKLPSLASIGFDAYYLKEDFFRNGKRGLFSRYSDLVVNFQEIVSQQDKTQSIISKDNLLEVAEVLAKDNDSIEEDEAKELVNAIWAIKKHMISNSNGNLTFGDFDIVVFYAKLALEGLSGYFEVNDQVEDLDDDKIWNTRERVQEIMTLTSSNLKEIVANRKVEVKAFDLQSMLEETFEHLKEVDDLEIDLNYDLIETMIPIKKLILGGTETDFNLTQLSILIDKLAPLTAIGFDAFYLKEDFFNNGKRGLYNHYSQLVVDFQKIAHQQEETQTILTKDNLLDAAEVLADDNEFIKPDVAEELIDVFWTVKKHMISDSDGKLTFGDFDRVVFYAKLALEGLSGYIELDDKIENFEDEEYWDTRIDIQKIMTLTSSNLKNIIANRKVEVKSFDLQTMIEETFEHLKEVDNLDIELNYDFIETIIPIKKLIVGGTERDFNLTQLSILVDKLPVLVRLGFDLSYYDDENFDSDEQKSAFYLESIKEVKNQLYIYDNPEEELIYTDENIISLLNELLNDDESYEEPINFESFEDSIASAKTKFIGGTSDRYTVKTFQTILDYAEEIAAQNYYNEIAWNANIERIENPKPIKSNEIKTPHSDLFPLLTKSEVGKYSNEFKDLLVKLRLYRTKEGKQLYSHKIARTKYGLNETSIARFAVKKLLGAYCSNEGKDPYKCGVTAEELNLFLNDFRSLLEEFNLWSPNIASFANNCLYLADLFQSVSNGDMRIGLDEGVEYSNLILSAVKMGTDVMDALGENGLCENITVGDMKTKEEEPTYTLECYRKNFFDVFLNKLGYKEQLKSFASYYDNANENTRKEYLMYLEQFVRDTPENEYMRLRDITLLVGAIQNIESMILRFDINKSNVLEPNETENAFEVYRNIVVEQGGLTGWKKKFAKSAFLYMVKEMKFPEPSEVLTYHMNPFASKKVTAKRLNVASILYYFATL